MDGEQRMKESKRAKEKGHCVAIRFSYISDNIGHILTCMQIFFVPGAIDFVVCVVRGVSWNVLWVELSVVHECGLKFEE